jgi:hypothetical protein
MRRLLLLALLVLPLLSGAWGCGKKAPPQPPTPEGAVGAGVSR